MRADKESAKAGIYTYRWNGTYSVSIRIDRIKERSSKVDCEIGVRSKDKLVYHSGLNLLSHRARSDVSNSLINYRQYADDLNWKEFPWQDVVQWACTRTLELFRQGEPPLKLGNEPIENIKHLVFPFVVQDQANMIYAPGESSKSLFAMLLSCIIQSGAEVAGIKPTTSKNVLYLDYETSPSEFNSRVIRLKNANGLDKDLSILYRWSFQPLNNEFEAIQEIVSKNNIGFIVVDSFTKASEGDTNEGQVAAKFYRALREIGCTSLILDHVSKENIKGNGGNAPIGSIVKFNDARNIFTIKADVDDEKDSIEIMFKHVKFNNGKKVKPFGYNLSFFDDGILVEKSDVTKNPVLSKELSLKYQIDSVLTYPMTPQEIASELNAKEGTVTTTLNRNKGNMFVKLMDNKWGKARKGE